MSGRGGEPNTDVGGRPLNVPRMLGNVSFLLTNRWDKTRSVSQAYRTWVSDSRKVGTGGRGSRKRSGARSVLQ